MRGSGFCDARGGTGRGAPPAREGGFTLLEVMIAMTILAVALMGVLSLYANTMILAEVNKNSRTATFAAQQKVEEVRGLVSPTATDPLSAVRTAYPSGTTTYFAVSGLAVYGSEPNPGSVVVDYTNANLLNVTVKVHWKGVRGEDSVTVTTMLSP